MTRKRNSFMSKQQELERKKSWKKLNEMTQSNMIPYSKPFVILCLKAQAALLKTVNLTGAKSSALRLLGKGMTCKGNLCLYAKRNSSVGIQRKHLHGNDPWQH